MPQRRRRGDGEEEDEADAFDTPSDSVPSEDGEEEKLTTSQAVPRSDRYFLHDSREGEENAKEDKKLRGRENVQTKMRESDDPAGGGKWKNDMWEELYGS